MGDRTIYIFLAAISALVIACGSSGSADSASGDVASANQDAVATTDARLPGAPVIVRVTPGEGFATIDWSAPESAGGVDDGPVVSRYVVTGFPDGSRSLEGDVHSARVGGLTNGQEYTFTVRAATEAGFGPDSGTSQTVLVAAPPGPPPSVAATELNAGGVRLAWLAPPRDGGSEIATYVVNSETAGHTYVFKGEPLTGYSLVGTPDLMTRPGLADGSSLVYVIELDDAAPSDRYRIAASNVRGLGQWSLWTKGPADEPAAANAVLDLMTNPDAEPDDGVVGPGTDEVVSDPSETAPDQTQSTGTPQPVVTGTPLPVESSGTPEPTANEPTPTPGPTGPGAVITVKWLPTLYGEDGPPKDWTPTLLGDASTPFLLNSIEAWSTDPVDVFRADIDWGDGTTAQGWFEDAELISSRTADGVAQLFAYHTFSEPGRYTMTITVSAINHSGVVGQTTLDALISQ